MEREPYEVLRRIRREGRSCRVAIEGVQEAVQGSWESWFLRGSVGGGRLFDVLPTEKMLYARIDDAEKL